MEWVYSGGSAKGLVHIGVIRVLEDASDELARVASEMDWDGLVRVRVDRRLTPADRKAFEEGVLVTVGLEDRNLRLPQGLVSGQRLGQELSALTLWVHGPGPASKAGSW